MPGSVREWMTRSYSPAGRSIGYFFFLPPGLAPPFGFFPPLFDPGPLSGIWPSPWDDGRPRLYALAASPGQIGSGL
jgi:hypothetical protein